MAESRSMTENPNPYSGAQPGPNPQASPPPGPQQDPPPSESSEESFFNSIRRSGFFRTEERWIGGVAGGVARKFGLDPLLVRGLLAASLLLVGAGLVLYGVAWALLPEERDGRIHFQEMMRGNFDGALVGAGLAILAGFSWGSFSLFPFSYLNGWFTGLLWVAGTAAVIVIIVVAVNKNRGATANPVAGGPAPAPYTGAYQQGSTPSMPSPNSSSTSGAPTAAPVFGPRNVHEQHQPNHPTPAQPSGPTPPPPTKAHGPGGAFVGALLGIWALIAAGVLIADRTGQFSIPVTVILAATLIGVCGLGIIVSGVRGRTSGTFGAIAIISLILTLPMVAWTGTNLKFSEATHAGVGEAVFAPTSAAEAEAGYAALIGDWELDLTNLPPTADPIDVTISVAVGELVVRMPAESNWSAQVTLGVGEVRVDAPENSTTRSGVLIGNHNLSSQSVADGASADYDLTIRGALGEITIIEEQL